MKNTSNSFIVLLCVCLFPVFLLGQQKSAPQNKKKEQLLKGRVVAMGRNYGDSIVIRWAVTEPAIWMLANKAGYQVYKVTYEKDGSVTNEVLNTEPIKPLSQEAMLNRYKDETHPYGMVATQFLYGAVDLTMEGDEGLVATLRNQRDAQNMRFSYCMLAADFDPDVASSLGLRYVYYPKKSDTQKEYEFRVCSLLKDADVATGVCYVEKDKIHEKSAGLELFDPESLPTGVRIFWKKDSRFTAYFIERSTDGKNFTQINKNPFITSHMDDEEIGNASVSKINLPNGAGKQQNEDSRNYMKSVRIYEFYDDNLPEGDTTLYYYRVRGIDAFGEYSEYSKVISSRAKSPDTDKAPTGMKITRLGKGKFQISWEKPLNTEGLKGYSVFRRHTISEDFKVLNEQILPLTTTSFIHSGVEEGEMNFYRVASVSKEGKFYKTVEESAYEKDITPPQRPVGLVASFEKTGMGLITWEANKEKDLKGYKVFIRYSDNEDWVQITEYPVKDNYLFDVRQLKSLTRKVYYSVIAVDISGNLSDYSEAVEAVLPDIVPPVAPLLSDYTLYEGKLMLEYIPSSSDDVKVHNFYKKKEGGEWELVKSYTPSDIVNNRINIIDETIARNVHYTFVLEAEDEAGLATVSKELPIILRGLEPENIKISLLANVDSKTKNVNLSWNQPELKHHKKYYFVLYKKAGDANWQAVDSFNQGVGTGIDYKVKAGVAYEYKIAVFVSGVDLGQSQPIKVEVK